MKKATSEKDLLSSIESVSKAVEERRSSFWSDVNDVRRKEFDREQKRKTPDTSKSLPEIKTVQ